MMADKETFCPGRQQHVGTGLIDRLARSAHTLDGERQLVKWRRWIASCILDRQSRDARRDVRIDRNIDPARDFGYVCQVTLTSERNFGVRQPLREGEARACRRQRGKSKL